MAAPSAFQFYGNNLDLLKITDLTAATIKLALLASTYTPNTTNTGHTVYTDLTNELATANGYTLGGATLATPSIPAFSTTGFDLFTGNASWTSSGAGLSAWRYGVVYVSGALWGITSPLLGYFTGDSTPADIPLTAVGNILQINCPANGWFTLTRT
jgi:hypothetical protein